MHKQKLRISERRYKVSNFKRGNEHLITDHVQVHFPTTLKKDIKTRACAVQICNEIVINSFDRLVFNCTHFNYIHYMELCNLELPWQMVSFLLSLFY